MKETEKNIISFKGKKRTKFDSTQEKISAVDKETIIYELLCGNLNIAEDLGIDLELDYYLHYGEAGSPVIMRRNKVDDTYQILEENYLVSDIFERFNRYIRDKGDEYPKYLISTTMIMRGVIAWVYQNNRWVNKRILEKMPVQTRFKSEEGPCFTRLGYDPIKSEDLESEAPIFYGMLKRMSNSEAFVRKVGSFFDREGYRKQSIWLYGNTDGGKSAIQNLVQMMMGGTSNSVALTTESLRSPFFKEMLVGKSLWMVREADAKFLNTDEYKSLTGDEMHLINPKGRRMYSVTLHGHWVFSSNDKPAIRNEDALIERVIPCLCQPVPLSEQIDSVRLNRLLEEEIPYIAGYCIEKYSEHGRKKIDFDKTELEEAIEEAEWEMQAMFDSHFAFDETKDKGAATVTSSMLNAVINPGGHSNDQFSRKFREFLKRKYGCDIGYAKKVEGRTQRYVTRIRRLKLSEREHF